eukprot:gene5160-6422_t
MIGTFSLMYLYLLSMPRNLSLTVKYIPGDTKKKTICRKIWKKDNIFFTCDNTKVEVEYDNVFYKVENHSRKLNSKHIVKSLFGKSDDDPDTLYQLCYYSTTDNNVSVSTTDKNNPIVLNDKIEDNNVDDVQEFFIRRILERFPTLLEDYTKPPPSREGMDMEINTIGNSVPKPRIYQVPKNLKDKVIVVLKDLVEKGFIRDSNSPFASPIVVAMKPDGSIRFCCDYQSLNAITIRD